MNEKDKNIALQLKEKIFEKYSKYVEEIHFYGSRVQKNESDSDFDILIVTFQKISWKREREISFLIYEFGLEHNILFHPLFLSHKQFFETMLNAPLIENIKATGITL